MSECSLVHVVRKMVDRHWLFYMVRYHYEMAQNGHAVPDSQNAGRLISGAAVYDESIIRYFIIKILSHFIYTTIEIYFNSCSCCLVLISSAR
jgi:hypothetical protein